MNVTEMYEHMTEDEIIENLLEKYKDDKDAVEEILRAKNNLDYVRMRKTGQTPKQYVLSLAGHLYMWY